MPAVPSVIAANIITLVPGEVAIPVGFDATLLLQRISEANIDSVTSVTCSPSGLSFGTPAVNAAAFSNWLDGTVEIGKGVRVAITPGSTERDYTVTCLAVAGSATIALLGIVRVTSSP